MQPSKGMREPGRGRTVMYLSGASYTLGSLRRLREAGFRIVTADRSADAPGHALGDERVLISIADPDAVERAARLMRAEAIIPGLEIAVVPAAIASERLGLGSIGRDVAERCTDKGLMRMAWAKSGLAQPEFVLVGPSGDLRQAVDAFGLPLVIKPRRSNGSKGVSVVLAALDIDDAIRDAIEHADGAGCIVERYIEGPLLTADGFADESRVEVAAMGDVETQAISRFRVNMSLNYPAKFPSQVVDEATELVAKAVRALGLANSAFHCECIVSDRGVRLVELGARSGGSYIGSEIVPSVSGIASAALSAQLLLGDSPDITPARLGGASLTFLSAPPGRIERIEGLIEAARMPGVIDVGVAVHPGDSGGAVAFDNARHGHVVTVGASRDEAVSHARAAAAAIRFVVAEKV